MKNNKLQFGLLYSFALLLASILNLFAQQPRYQGEIMVTVCGMTGQDKKWTVNATALSSTRWYIVNNECYITTDYSSASVSGEGNDAMPNGFRCPCQHVGHGEDLAFSKYEFSWDLPYPLSDPDPITLGLRDADWACNYTNHDITIRYNITSSKYEVRIGGQGNPFNELTDDTIWDILNEAPPNQAAFQPTKSSYFFCDNPNAVGQHPIFYWLPADHVDPDLIKYKIYQNLYSGKFIIGTYLVAQNLTDCDWTDNSVVIDPS